MAGQPRRPFSSTSRRNDVFFVNMPGVKQGESAEEWEAAAPADKIPTALLVVIKTTLVLLPISWRWGFFS